jgi:hypothetical protein
MLVETIHNGSQDNPMLTVYKAYNPSRKLFEVKPFCLIHEEDFFELFEDPEKTLDNAIKTGKYMFNVKLDELSQRAKIVY